MSPQQIVAVMARLLAVWIVIHLPGQAGEFVFASSRGADSGLRVFAACAFVVEVLASVVLWFFPLTVTRKLLRSSSDERPPPASSDVWLGMGCALIGLWLLATSLPALVIDGLILASSINASGDVSSSLRQNVVYYVAEVAIAAWLILGARGFREVFWWARNAGVSKPVE
jgi:hypothetical protein